MLTPKEVDEFKRLAFEVYGAKLTDDQARDQGSRLIQLFELILKNKRKSRDIEIQVKKEQNKNKY